MSSEIADLVEKIIQGIDTLDTLCSQVSIETHELQESIQEEDTVSFFTIVVVLLQDAIPAEWEHNRLRKTALLEFRKSAFDFLTTVSDLITDFNTLRKKWLVKWRHSDFFHKKIEKFKISQLQCHKRATMLLTIVSVPETIYFPQTSTTTSSSRPNSPDKPIESAYIREQRRLQQLEAQKAHRARSLDGIQYILDDKNNGAPAF